jgi:hypothetical protein
MMYTHPSFRCDSILPGPALMKRKHSQRSRAVSTLGSPSIG